MPRKTVHSPPGAGGPEQADQYLHFIRYAHIFASVVRDILEIKFLSEVTKNPLTLTQFHLLKLISLNGHHQMGEIADFLGVSQPAATKNIDKLERLGLVSRTPSKGDRRAILLTVNTRGRRLVEKYEKLKAMRMASVLEALGPGQLDQLAQLLERFSLGVIRQEDSEDGLCLRCAAYCEEHCPVARVRGDCPYHRIRGFHRGADRGKEISRKTRP